MPFPPLTRRHYLGLATYSLLAACGPQKGSGYPGYALIATSGERSLAVLDLLSFQLLKPIQLGASPTLVVPASHGQRSYVLTPTNGSIHELNESLQVVRRIKVAGELSTLLLTADDAQLLAISSSNREFITLDAHNLSIIHREKLHSEPVSLDVTATGNAIVGLRGTPNLMYFPRQGNGRQATIDAEPGAVRFRADGQLLLVTKPAARSLAFLTVPDLQLMADLPLAMRPDNLCFTPDGGQLFVTGDGMDAVAIVFPYKTLEVEQTILAGRNPGVMACSTRPPFLFVASSDGSDLLVLDVETRRVIGLVQVGLEPVFIAITPDNQYALILNRGSNDLAIIRIPGIRPSYQRKNGVALYTLLPVGSTPVHAAVVSRA